MVSVDVKHYVYFIYFASYNRNGWLGVNTKLLTRVKINVAPDSCTEGHFGENKGLYRSEVFSAQIRSHIPAS